jgi:hypothetical protein
MCKVCTELASQLLQVETAKAEDAKSAAKKSAKSPFFHASGGDCKPQSRPRVSQRAGYYEFGLSRPLKDDKDEAGALGDDRSRKEQQHRWTPTTRDEVERLLVEGATSMQHARRWIASQHADTASTASGDFGGALVSSFASAASGYCGVLRRLQRLPSWRESPAGAVPYHDPSCVTSPHISPSVQG